MIHMIANGNTPDGRDILVDHLGNQIEHRSPSVRETKEVLQFPIFSSLIRTSHTHSRGLISATKNLLDLSLEVAFNFGPHIRKPTYPTRKLLHLLLK